MPFYEHVYLARQDLAPAQVESITEAFTKVVADNGGEVKSTEYWGLERSVFADGSEWDLVGHATPETRYGSAGERLFLEVAPLKVACNHPLMPNATCLRVRDVRYGENGVKTGEGEWRVFHGNIEGYEHREGTRNILRVNRYSLARNGQLPADAPSHAYVLDMVVESELTQ